MKKLGKVFSAFVKKSLTSETLESALNELNLLLIGNDVATETADALCEKIKESLKGEQIGRLTSKTKILFGILREIITEILTPERTIDLIEEIRKINKSSNPYVICFLGVFKTSARRSELVVDPIINK